MAIPANGDSALAFFWDPREIKPGAKREFAYALGQGVASKLENEGAVKVDLVGSFEPNKMFTIKPSSTIPRPGQSLTLELPDGLERLEGKETQPVPAGDADGNRLIQWKARVLRPGQYPPARPFHRGHDADEDHHGNQGVTSDRPLTA